MKVRDEPDGGITVTTLTWWPLLAALGFAYAALGIWHREPSRRGDGIWAAVVVLAAVTCLAGLEQGVFHFDAARRELRWRRRRLLRSAGGTIPFADITGLSLEQAFDSDTGRRSNARRVDLHTASGLIPLTTGYSGTNLTTQRAVAARIRDVLGNSWVIVE